MERETDTDKILRAIAGVHARGDDVLEKMATKDDLNKVVEMVGVLQGQVSSIDSSSGQGSPPRYLQALRRVPGALARYGDSGRRCWQPHSGEAPHEH